MEKKTSRKIMVNCLPKDDEGFIVNDTDANKISPDVERVIIEVKEIIIDSLSDSLHSVYLTGSIPRGKAKPYKSDLDIFAILNPGATGSALPAIREACNQILEETNIVSKIDIELWLFEEVFPLASSPNDIEIKDTLSIFDVILKNASLCIHGDDLSKYIPPIKPGIALANDELIAIHDDINQAREAISSAADPEEIQYWCKRVMKNIIRAGFCLCMPTIKEQTRDIDLCADIFSKHYPDMERTVKQAMVWIDKPSINSSDIVMFLEHEGALFLQKVDRWMEKYNPERQQEMPRNLV